MSARIVYNAPAIPLQLFASTPARIQARHFSSTTRLTKPKDMPAPPTLTHLNSTGEAHIVPISHKLPTHRTATAVQSLLFSSPSTYTALVNATLKKGDAIAVARIGGIQAAKRTSELIPLAHPGLGIEHVSVSIQPFPGAANTSASAALPPSQPENPDLPIPAQVTSLAPEGGVFITASVSCTAKTGVEMEALTAASVAALTMYDMLKGVDKGMRMGEGRVVAKAGGRGGGWRWDWERGEIVRDDDRGRPESGKEDEKGRG